MIRFYGNQAGYLPNGRKVVVLARTFENEKERKNGQDANRQLSEEHNIEAKWQAGKAQKVSLWNEKGEQIAVR